jgi:hypothetical protein
MDLMQSWDPAQPKEREPGRAKQQLHRPMGWGLGRMAVFLVGCHLEKPSTIYGFRVHTFSSPWCFTSAKCISSISAKSVVHGARAVCNSVPVAILDLQESNIYVN